MLGGELNPIITLILGLIGLWLGSELVIRGVNNIAAHFKISQIFLGLTILALGTDLPELFVVLNGAIARLSGIETSGISVGNVIGSSMGQAVLAIGVAGLVGLIRMTKRERQRDGMMLLASILVVFLLGIDGAYSVFDGLLLLLIYLTYFISIVREEKIISKVVNGSKFYPFWDAVSLLGGFVILVGASELTVNSSIAISAQFGITQTVVGILLVGLGTSLPELTTSIVAVRNNAPSLAIGNLIGSTIFDLLFVLGAGSTISGFVAERGILIIDLPALLFMSFVTLQFLREKRLSKNAAVGLIIMFGIYVIFRALLCDRLLCY